MSGVWGLVSYKTPLKLRHRPQKGTEYPYAVGPGGD
jgi:hypothetical protein